MIIPVHGLTTVVCDHEVPWIMLFLVLTICCDFALGTIDDHVISCSDIWYPAGGSELHDVYGSLPSTNYHSEAMNGYNYSHSFMMDDECLRIIIWMAVRSLLWRFCTDRYGIQLSSLQLAVTSKMSAKFIKVQWQSDEQMI